MFMGCTSVVCMCSKLVAGMQMFAEFDFAAHYTKAKYYVQILHPAPRVPYLHGCDHANEGEGSRDVGGCAHCSAPETSLFE